MISAVHDRFDADSVRAGESAALTARSRYLSSTAPSSLYGCFRCGWTVRHDPPRSASRQRHCRGTSGYGAPRSMSQYGTKRGSQGKRNPFGRNEERKQSR